ncbi:sensor histidine kinase [Ornithinibacillus xuwenensis]|uniref:histidine kinase n=1 Tax=Ornithinibacillus xuwenensis TaxID=3144668 RepID=A0ABU9XI08_9BACI
MKKTYFIWLAIHFIVWTSAYFELPSKLSEIQIASICVFYIILFVVPIFASKPKLQAVLFCIQVLSTISIFYPVDNVFNSYVVLIQALVIAEAVFYLSRFPSVMVISTQLGSAVLLLLEADLSTSIFIWYGLTYMLIVIALLYYQAIHRREVDGRRKNDALLDEYRRMKRQLITEEEQARQDERNMIGHEIHDSVGHKLTALIMQFEAFRLSAVDIDEKKITMLKELAEESLAETRTAVKSLKQREVGGLQGIIRLIRKLEIESFMKINFTVKHGAFAASLTGEQSFAIYRAVQEALTNIMKHGATREAQVIFESPGGSIFRFEVINRSSTNPFFQEGYGLRAMRDRIEKVGGSLEINQDERQFVISGTIRLIERSGAND